MKNELLKQWQQDVEDYSDNAYKIYERYYHNHDPQWLRFTTNGELFDNLKEYEIRRKQSAELPFDLERAKAGEAIERIVGNRWFLCKFKHIHEITKRIVVTHWNADYILDYSELRMKYPPKIN